MKREKLSDSVCMLITTELYCPIWWLHWNCTKGFKFRDSNMRFYQCYISDGWNPRLHSYIGKLRNLIFK